jgi:RNA polymerase sigma-70 factor (ECF subfamily)
VTFGIETVESQAIADRGFSESGWMASGPDEVGERATAQGTNDAAALEEFIRRHGGRLLAVARRFLRSEHDCHDVVQEALLSAFQALDSFAGTSTLGTWLHRIVVNACLMRLRKEKRRGAVLIDDLLPRFDDAGRHALEPACRSESPERRLDRNELRSKVRAAIDRLPEPHLSILILRDIEELDTEETAELLGISIDAVKTRLHRARQALKTLLEPWLKA